MQDTPQESASTRIGHAGAWSPLVSVAMTSFHSERWIARALDSVLRQRTDFDVEIVVGDDCSTDATLVIAREYEARYPRRIYIAERPTRLGMQRNYFDTFEHCTGKYIAWLDADDYWTDPDKLTLQIQALEQDRSLSACGHFVRQVSSADVVGAAIGPFVRRPSVKPGRYDLRTLIQSNIIPSPAIVFRNGIHRALPPWFFNLRGLVDWPILVAAALAGDVLLMDRVMADYVLTPGSAYMSKGALYQEAIDLEFCEHMADMLPGEFHSVVRSSTGKRHEAIAYLLLRENRMREARQAAWLAVTTPDTLDNIPGKLKSLVSTYVRSVMPALRGRPDR